MPSIPISVSSKCHSDIDVGFADMLQCAQVERKHTLTMTTQTTGLLSHTVDNDNNACTRGRGLVPCAMC